MQANPEVFYNAALSAGAIFSGFCGTFLSFRIQREATYHRQPVLDFESAKAKDVYIGLSHFSTSFLLLILATLFAVFFGVIIPLLALAGVSFLLEEMKFTVAGLISAVICVLGYFICELVHYEVLNRRLLNDINEWGRARLTISCTLLATLLTWLLVWWRF